MVHTVLGGAVGTVWLVLPGMTSGADVPVAIKEPTPAVSTTAVAVTTAGGGRSTVDLVLPLVAVGAAGAAAGYAYIRRVRRAHGRTTPGGASSPPHPPGPPQSASRPALDEQACAALVAADDRIRAARCELGFAEALFAAEDTARFRRTVDEAAAELAAAFRMRQRYDEGVPKEEAARGHALAGIVGRCEEAQGLLDSAAGAFEGLREPGRASGQALVVAEGRFRELTGRVGAAEAVLAGLRARYAPTATADVVGNVEQARDRLLFATVRLNEARQSADSGQREQVARQLRAAEGAITQAGVLLEGVDRLAAELQAAEQAVPAALAAAEAELSRARAEAEATEEGSEGQGEGEEEAPDASPGELHARLLRTDAVLASIRRGLPGRQPAAGKPDSRPAGPDSHRRDAHGRTPHGPDSDGGPDTGGQGAHEAGWDPVGVLRRIVRATASHGAERDGALQAAALITARTAGGAAADFVETHRGAVGVTARTRLAEAQRLLATGDPADRASAEALAEEARELAELDVRAHGNPYGGPDHTAGVGGAVLGGVVPAEDPDGGTPAGFAGPAAPAADG
ncbi:hypothetical protein GCM10010269_64040 [Streptomyces humidus]|uniref:TPM domain-containing protein n=1 Tax=Streptomyces humidus TaxID=52259 RepID=A0A918G2D7_9ACTN|nr:hypothetical protein GCM10010269_64040 [Streptomyces humidus]